MNRFIKDIHEKILVFDGSKGYMLQTMGMKGGECPELWNVNHAGEVKKLYTLYREAGSDVIQTNTFQGNRLKLEEYSIGDRTYELNYEGVRIAKEVMGRNGYVAASIGPLGKLFEPSGDLTFQCAYEVFKEQVKAVADGGADIINFETFTDVAEMRAALIAARDVCDLPVICSMAFEANGKTLMGTDPYTAAVILKSLGADMIGANCSFGPGHMLEIIKRMADAGGIYLCVKPNAGLPELVDGNTIYRESPENFAALSKEFIQYGVRLIGGCCGTTPEFIKALKSGIGGVEVSAAKNRSESVITSASKSIILDGKNGLNIGKINSFRDEELLRELAQGNVEYIAERAMDMAYEGYDAVYVNVDNAAGESAELLADVVNIAQGYIREPFILETENADALLRALRIYRGKAGVILGYGAGMDLEEMLSAAGKFGSTIIDRKML